MREAVPVRRPSGRRYHTAMNMPYAQRRQALARQLGEGGIAIIPTAAEQPRNRDSAFLFRHDSYFYYLTGFT